MPEPRDLGQSVFPQSVAMADLSHCNRRDLA